MATLYAIGQALLQRNPESYPDANKNGKVYCLYDKYTLTADLSANDVINFGKLPKGARVIDAMIKYADLDASGGTLDLGWDGGTNSAETADDNGFISAADCTSADTIKGSDNLANAPGIGHEFTDEVNVQVKINGDTDATSGDIEVFVWYIK